MEPVVITEKDLTDAYDEGYQRGYEVGWCDGYGDGVYETSAES